jgi:hypothetical protein
MKKPLIIASAITCVFLFFTNANAQRAWRVNQIASINANFTSLQVAIDSAAHGDTLYVEPGNYGIINLSKRLMIYGVGFDINLYDTATAHKSESVITTITLLSGATGSAIEGLNIASNLFIGANQAVANILIKRCKVAGLNLNPAASTAFFSANNWIITQCLITSSISIGNTSNGSTITNCIFSNNIFRLSSLSMAASSPPSYSFSGIIFDRNVIRISGNTFSHREAIFSNNIFSVNSLPTTGASTFNSNIFVNQQPATPGDNGYTTSNVFGVNAADIFVFETWVSSNVPPLVTHYQLKTGSPARNAATDGSDCGIFGGTSPMPIPPMPSNPRIYSFEADATSNPSTNQLRFRIKARSGD